MLFMDGFAMLDTISPTTCQKTLDAMLWPDQNKWEILLVLINIYSYDGLYVSFDNKIAFWECSFSQLLKHIFWKHASYSQNSTHKSKKTHTQWAKSLTSPAKWNFPFKTVLFLLKMLFCCQMTHTNHHMNRHL